MAAAARARLAIPAALALLALLTMGDLRLRERVLSASPADRDFVARNMAGIMEGRPVSRSWQHRVLAPATISGIAALGVDRAKVVDGFSAVMVAGANLLLFLLVLPPRGPRAALLSVAVFALSYLLLLYRLEYPWDGVDLLLFLFFGYWAARQGPLLPLAPLLLLGALNHETILWVPLWYLLAPLDPQHRASAGARRWRVELAVAAGAGVVVAGIIWLLRQRLYVGRPSVPGQVFEPSLPLVDNHFHLGHNLEQLFLENWTGGRIFLSVVVLVAIGVFGWLAVDRRHRHHRPAAVWSLLVLACIGCFGYTNETRHYLPLLAFWFGHTAPQLRGSATT